MTSLPITSSAPQTTAVAKQAAGSAETSDAQNSAPFGEVLARQIKDPTARDVNVDDKVTMDTALSQLGTDVTVNKKEAADTKKDMPDFKKAHPVGTNNAATLPADMLAAMLPQAMNSSATTPVTFPPTSSKADSAPITASAPQVKLDIGAPKADVVASAKAGNVAQAITGVNQGTQVKEQTFADALTDSANRTSASTQLNAASREAVAASTAPQSNAAALAALQNTVASNALPVMQAVQVAINTPISQDKWSDEFTQKITWLASSNKDQTAELHLNPPQLGPLDVVIKVNGDQATALFTSPHAAVRDAIEQAMPKLRDMLADNGILLGNATVSDQAPRDQSQSNAQRSSAPINTDIRDIPQASNSTARVSQISRHNGIVDTFA